MPKTTISCIYPEDHFLTNINLVDETEDLEFQISYVLLSELFIFLNTTNFYWSRKFSFFFFFFFFSIDKNLSKIMFYLVSRQNRTD